MATVTHVYTIEYVANMLDENLEMIETIIENHDNLSYGTIINVQTGKENVTTGLTYGGIEELKDMLANARRSSRAVPVHLESFL